MMFRGGSAYLIGTVAASSNINSPDVTEKHRYEYFNNVIYFADWVRHQMETAEKEHVSSTHWATRSHREWIARQDPFQTYGLRDDLLKFTGPCKDPNTGDNAKYDVGIPIQSATECEERCKHYGQSFPLTACQYEASLGWCQFITEETFYGDGSSSDIVCFIFAKNISGKEKFRKRMKRMIIYRL